MGCLLCVYAFIIVFLTEFDFAKKCNFQIAITQVYGKLCIICFDTK